MLEVRDLLGDLLANGFLSGDSQSSLIILTGPRSAGKTNLCLQLFDSATQMGAQTKGLISKPVYEGQKKIAIDLIDLSTGDQRRLAHPRPKDHRERTTPGWIFDQQALQWGNSILAHVEKTQLLIVDELGPLEFSYQAGWQDAFHVIEKRDYRCAVVVIRPTLLRLAKERWPWAEVMKIQGGSYD